MLSKTGSKVGTTSIVTHYKVGFGFLTLEFIAIVRNNQKIVIFRRSLRPKSEQTTHDRLEMEKVGIIGSLEQAEVSESGLIDFLHVVAFILECIVANPVLYDRKNDRYRNEFFKLKVWNEICTMFHDKGKMV